MPSSWSNAGNDTLSTSAPHNAKTVVSLSGTAGAAGTQCVVRFQAADSTSNITPGHGRVDVTIHFIAPPPPTCTPPTQPTISSIPASANGNNGYFTSIPTISASSTTSGTTISYSTDGTTFVSTAPVLVEGITTIYAKAASSATCESTVTEREFKVDTRAPEISGSDVSDTAWRNTPLFEDFTAFDPAPSSGLTLAADVSFRLTASDESTKNPDGTFTPTEVSKAVTDNAGNSTTRTLSAFIDLTPPSSSVTGVDNGATYTLGSVPTVGCSSSDTLSGVATNATPIVSGGPVGAVTVSCNGASDHAGNVQNVASMSVTYNVHYAFGGWQNPLASLPFRNQVKAGRAVPVRFSLGGDQGLAIFKNSTATNAGSPTSTSQTCTVAEIDPVEETLSAGSSSLSYDASTDMYTYVWKTDAAWAGKCRVFSLNLKDGSTRQISFNFTK